MRDDTHHAAGKITVLQPSRARAEYADDQWRERLGRTDIFWLTPASSDRLTLVKENALRRVYKVEHAGTPLYVKQHLRRGAVQRVRDLLLGSPAMNEYRAGRYAARHGVPAIEIVARGERADRWRPHLSATISVAIEGGRPLAEVFEGIRALSGRERKAESDALAAATAELLARAHDEAFLHPDSHPGNILVTGSGSEGYNCVFVDVYGARCGRPITEQEASRNLASLNQWFERRATRTERLRFLRAYLERRGLCGTRQRRKAFTSRVLADALRHRHAMYRKRDRRIGRNNAYFASKHLRAGWRGWCTLRFRQWTAMFAAPLPQPDQDDWSRALLRRLPGMFRHDTTLVVRGHADAETFFAHSSLDSLAWLVHGSPAECRYRTALWALNRDVPCVAGMVCLFRRRGLLDDRSSWLSGAPQRGVPLLRWLERTSGTRRAAGLEAVGRLIAVTARSGIVVRNASPVRVELVRTATGGTLAYWRGIEGQALRRPLRSHVLVWMCAEGARRLRNVNGVSRADRARVLRACCLALGFVRTGEDWRALWREVQTELE